MKKSDLVDIGIKMFGIYFLVIVLTEVKSLAIMWGTEKMFIPNMKGMSIPLEVIVPYCMHIAFDSCLAWLLLFRTKLVTRKILKGETHVEGSFGIDKKSAVQMGIIVVGGFMLTGTIETLGTQIIGIYQAQKTNTALHPNAIPELIWRCVYGIVGYALITSSGAIAKWLAGDGAKKLPEQENNSRLNVQYKINMRQRARRRPVIPKKNKPADKS